MKTFLILTGVLTIVFVAVLDTKARIDELDEIAATTPAQMEMKSDINKSKGKGVMQQFETSQPPGSTNPVSPKIDMLRNPQSNTVPHPTKTFRPSRPQPQNP